MANRESNFIHHDLEAAILAPSLAEIARFVQVKW
jgi:hypothetical protein